VTEGGDRMVDRVADGLDQAAQEAASRPVPDRATEELRSDADFLRRLKPSLILARLRGAAPTDTDPERGRAAPSGPQVRVAGGGNGEPNPFVVIGAAFVLGIVLAKLIDWRGHAHPRR
jgi:hypothetical protein